MRLRNSKTTFGNVQENMQFKVRGLLHKHKHVTVSNVRDSQTSSRKFVGVCKRGNGYGARVWNPVTRKSYRLGTFKSAGEASMAYLAKKKEFEKQIKRKKGVVCDEGIKKVGDQRDPCLENQESKNNSHMIEKEMVGINKTRSGKYGARIRHPINKKYIWLGTFGSHEEAAMVYLAKKAELEKETQSNEEEVEFDTRIVEFVCKNDGIKKSSCDQLDPSLEGLHRDPCCSDNQDSSMNIEPNDSFNDESASRMENLPIERNVELEKELEGAEEMEWAVSKDDEISNNSDQLGSILQEINHGPTSNNQDIAIPMESIHSFDGESPSRMENIPIEKNVELEKELQGAEGMESAVGKDDEVGNNSDKLFSILQENNHEPSSNNQDFTILMEPIDSFDGEGDSRMANTPIQKNGECGLSTNSSIRSESGAEILLRTESGEPIMDSHGFLLGKWSWIDDLRLPDWSCIDDLN